MSGIIVPDKETAKTLNTLARHKMIERLYQDILMDLQICDVEGWDKSEYINEIKYAVNSIGNTKERDGDE